MTFSDYFPDISDYNMRDFRQIILYRWQYDIYAVRGMIEYLNKSLNDSICDEIERQMQYNKTAQWEKHEESVAKVAHLHSISPYAFSSCVLSIYSITETCLDRYCAMCADKSKLKAQLDDMQGRGITRAITYLEKVIQVEEIRSDGLHGKLKIINDLRNDIIHSAGITTPKKAKVYKAELGVELSEEGIVEITYDNAIDIHSLCDQFIRFVLSRNFTIPLPE